MLSTAPTAYRGMLAAGGLDRLASLRRCVSAGEALPEAVWREFRARTGLRIIDGIGSTECCTFSSPPPRMTSARGPPAGRYPATAPPCSTTTAARSPTASPATSR